MKNDKWLKWKIALIGTAGMAVLFHTVKTSPEFASAQAANDAQKVAASGSDSGDDAVINEWQREGDVVTPQTSDSNTAQGNEAGTDGEYVGPRYSRHGGHGWRGGSSSGEGSQSSGSGSSSSEGSQSFGSGSSSGDSGQSLDSGQSQSNESDFTSRTGRS